MRLRTRVSARRCVVGAAAFIAAIFISGQALPQGDWQATHRRAVELYSVGKYAEALPLLEQAAELAKALERRRPDVSKSYYFLAHAYWKAGLIYVALPGKSGEDLLVVSQGTSPGFIAGGLLAVAETVRRLERAGRTHGSKEKALSRQDLEWIAELCRNAETAVAQFAKEGGVGSPPRYECVVVDDRIGVFDTRIEHYFQRALTIQRTDLKSQTKQVNDTLQDLSRFYRAIGRRSDAAALEAQLTAK